MKRLVILRGCLAVVALMVGGMYVGRRNQMVVKNQAVKAQWAQVDVVLQRRADLIPNLVETVKGYAAQEQTVFGDIAKARSALLGAQTPADRIAANGALMARWAGCWPSRRTIRSSNPTRIFCSCRTNWPAPKIASPSSAAATTRPFRTTTPTSSSSRTISLRDGPASSPIVPTSRRRKPRAKCPRCNSRRQRRRQPQK